MSGKQLVMSTTIIMVLAASLLFYGEYVHCATRITPMNNGTDDMLSLLQFREAIITSDPGGYLSSWNSSISYCKWEGITCSRRHPTGRVTGLNLTGQSLGGQISPSLENLTFLGVIDLSLNAFSGQLPDLNRLRKLVHLDLNSNHLQGPFAHDALRNCSNLSYLDLSGNLLAGPIPPTIGFLSNLRYLILEQNNFTGVIPSSLYNMSQLWFLDLSDNQLEGSIPEELGRLSNLGGLALAGNRLSGSIPPTIFNYSSLFYLELRSNFLRTALPSTIGNTLPRIGALFLSDNMFHGPIPASLGNASRLRFVNFQSNGFSGRIPTSLGKLPVLQYLNLGQNKLEVKDAEGWEFLDALGNCSIFQELSLSGNQIPGSIPNTIGNLSSSLEYLALARNYLSGTVPESIGNLDLLHLDLSDNNLGGPIGSWVGKMKSLQIMNLRNNNFSGL